MTSMLRARGCRHSRTGKVAGVVAPPIPGSSPPGLRARRSRWPRVVRRRSPAPTRLGRRRRRLRRRTRRRRHRPLRHDRRRRARRSRPARPPRRERHRGRRRAARRRRRARRRHAGRRVVGDGVRGDRQQPDPAHRGSGAAARPDVRLRPPAGVGRGARRGVADGAVRVGARRCCGPAIPLAADGTSSLARALTAGLGHRFGEADPGAQFVHHDDVASAVALAVERRLDGVYNVAPDGSIPGDRVRALSGRRFRSAAAGPDRRSGRLVAVAVPARSDPARAAVVHASPVDRRQRQAARRGLVADGLQRAGLRRGHRGQVVDDGDAEAPSGDRARRR